ELQQCQRRQCHQQRNRQRLFQLKTSLKGESGQCGPGRFLLLRLSLGPGTEALRDWRPQDTLPGYQYKLLQRVGWLAGARKEGLAKETRSGRDELRHHYLGPSLAIRRGSPDPGAPGTRQPGASVPLRPVSLQLRPPGEGAWDAARVPEPFPSSSIRSRPSLHRGSHGLGGRKERGRTAGKARRGRRVGEEGRSEGEGASLLRGAAHLPPAGGDSGFPLAPSRRVSPLPRPPAPRARAAAVGVCAREGRRLSLAPAFAGGGGRPASLSGSGGGGGFRSPAAKMLKVTVPSCSSSSCSSVTASAAPGTASLVPDYWIDGSNRDALSDFFEVESELGRGATSIVYRCKQKGTQKPYALKVLKKTVDKKIVRTEIGVLLRLSHPNIPVKKIHCFPKSFQSALRGSASRTM
uniref:Calcium/calmodulin dependent protein kinase IV n=1 Tax=Callithrix jacchus TaxID=9483 RepID=A0A5F4VSP9_CALJA